MNDSNSSRHQDCLFLFVLTLFSTLSYAFELGFYSDDWHFLERFQHAEDQSWPGYFAAIFEPHTRGRPVQMAYQAGLFALVGTNAAPLHLTNAVVLALGAACLYLLLRELLSRPVSFGVTLIYTTMPHYSTNRFWFASNQVALSAVLCFLSGWLLFQHGRGTQSRGSAPRAFILFLAVTAMALSSLAYETHLELFLLFGVVAAWKIHQESDSRFKSLLNGPGLYVSVLVGIYGWKQWISTRGAGIDSIAGRAIWFARNTALAQLKDFIDLGVALPFLMARKGLQGDLDLATLLVALLCGIGCYLYLRSMGHPLTSVARRTSLQLIVAGLALSLFLRSLFFFSHGWIVSVLGSANRVDMAAALGVALAALGALLLISDRFSERWPHFGSLVLAFAVFVQLLCVGLAGESWAKSWTVQEQILADLKTDLPNLDSDSTLILDTCRATGAAPIFETPWGVTGALRVQYKNRELEGNILSEDWRATDDHLEIWTYHQRRSYPYSDQTWIYQWPSRSVIRMDSAEALLGISPTHPECPLARAGHGSPILGGVLDALFRYKFGPLA